MLLILDGAEHREAVAPVVERLLADCASLRLLVTAGSPLSVGGELVVDVKPLALPSARNWLSLSEEERGAAVGLFVERARTVQPELALTMANAVAIAEICRRLDG